MYELLSRIVQGRVNDGDMELLLELSETVKATSLCGLGQGAPNPVLSTMKYFQHEYLAHVAEHVCPAGQCQFEALTQEVQA
jgi:NADP-reducing hydrogenase subunit HndC